MITDIQFKIEELSNSEKPEDRQLAARVSTDIEILKKLSKDSNSYVRFFVASNLNTPIEILEVLSKDEFKGVRYCVSYNKNTSNEILKELLNDEYCKESAFDTLIKKKGMQLLS